MYKLERVIVLGFTGQNMKLLIPVQQYILRRDKSEWNTIVNPLYVCCNNLMKRSVKPKLEAWSLKADKSAQCDLWLTALNYFGWQAVANRVATTTDLLTIVAVVLTQLRHRPRSFSLLFTSCYSPSKLAGRSIPTLSASCRNRHRTQTCPTIFQVIHPNHTQISQKRITSSLTTIWLMLSHMAKLLNIRRSLLNPQRSAPIILLRLQQRTRNNRIPANTVGSPRTRGYILQHPERFLSIHPRNWILELFGRKCVDFTSSPSKLFDSWCVSWRYSQNLWHVGYMLSLSLFKHQ